MATDPIPTVENPPAAPATGWDDFAVLTPTPPDETFWRKHNGNLEVPTSLVLSLFILSSAFATFAFLMLYAIGNGPDKPMPPISLVDGGGPDEAGTGSTNAGESGPDPLNAEPTTPRESVPQPDAPTAALPEVTTRPERLPSVDIGKTPSPPTESSFGALSDQVNKKMTVGLGGTKSGIGRSGDGPGAGEKGTGADMTKARSLRWVMKFETVGGRDYLDQLHALGAVVLIPVPGQDGQFYLFRDLKNPAPGAKTTDAEMVQYQSQIQFSDNDRDTLAKLAPALKLDFTPPTFFAVFPKGLERELADKERAYRGMRPEEIGTTRFAVTRSGGAYRLQVVEQTRR